MFRERYYPFIKPKCLGNKNIILSPNVWVMELKYFKMAIAFHKEKKVQI